MNEKLLKDLLDKYLTGTISPADKTELARLIDEPAYRRKLESLMEEAFREDIYEGEENPRLRVAMQEFLHEKINEKPAVYRVLRISNKMAAAAILVLGAISWLLIFNKQHQPTGRQKNIIQYDMRPGKPGAILTLANGNTIVLDSAQGTLPVQGNAQLLNRNGQLMYREQGNAAEVLYNTMSTPKGRQYLLVLADGSRVWLNAASSITYPSAFPGDERVVEISGEAYLEVAHNASKPFHVKVNGTDIQVLGTSFNVNAYADEPVMKTTLLEGSVSITKGKSKNMLKPGEQVQISGDGSMMIASNVDTEDVIAWKNGSFPMKGTGLDALMRQISRWYDVEVVYEGTLPQKTFGGSINRDVNLSDVLKALERYDIHSRIEKGRVIIEQ